ncbi:MAG: tyrosine-type recombinase/integrase [Nitrospiraceae bacterium]|nr:tyrosine-type recombinase/integrase [Nitrospiraceae bacterium]
MTTAGKVAYETLASAAGQSIEKFILESDRGAETRRVYGNALSIFVNWAEDMPLTTSLVRTFKTFLINKGLAPNTVSVYLSAVKQFLSYLVEKGVLPYNLANEVKRPRIPKTHQRDALTAEAARQLLANIPRNSLKGARDFAMINLMLRTGIREIEVSRACIGDITEKEGQRILEIHGKGRDAKDSFVVLTEEAHRPIVEYLATRQDADPSSALFTSAGNRSRGKLSTRAIRAVISKYLRDTGLKNRRITPHSLRHTAITLAIEGGGGDNLVQVQQMARHENISTTLGYFHEMKRIQNAAERAIHI